MIWLVLVCLWKKNNKIHWFQLSETLERLCVCPHEMFILHNKAEIIQKRTPPWDSLGYLATFSFMAGWYFHSQFGMYFIAFFFFFSICTNNKSRERKGNPVLKRTLHVCEHKEQKNVHRCKINPSNINDRKV